MQTKIYKPTLIASICCIALIVLAGCGDGGGAGQGGAQSGDQLLQAVQANDAQAVRQVVERNPDAVSARDGTGQTLLHHAAEADAPDVARVLLEAGADPNAMDSYGETPLEIMSRRGIRGTPTYRIIEDFGGEER